MQSLLGEWSKQRQTLAELRIGESKSEDFRVTPNSNIHVRLPNLPVRAQRGRGLLSPGCDVLIGNYRGILCGSRVSLET